MIGIFDSGVGGMTVARAVEQYCPGFPLLYFGDIARAPYGSKSGPTIEAYSVENARFLIEHGAKIIVVACNSAASMALNALRRQVRLPIIDVIGPAVATAVRESSQGRIGIIGTRATVASGVYEQKIKELLPGATVSSQPCPLLVPLVEEGWLHKRETKMILRRYLHPLRCRQVDTLILACTHYPLLKHLIGPRIGRRTRLIDSSIETAKTLRAYLDDHPQLASELYDPNGTSRFFVSDLPPATVSLAARIFQRPIELEPAHV